MDRWHCFVAEAERSHRALLEHFGTRLPEDVRTVLAYHRGCRAGYDRSVHEVIRLGAAHGLAFTVPAIRGGVQ